MSVALEPRSCGSPLRLLGWSGFPSSFVGRPSLLRASSGVAMPPSDRRGRKEECLAGNAVFRLFDVGNNFFRRLKRATAQAGQRQRSAHQLQKRAALDRIVPLFSVLRIFAFDKLAKLRSVRQFFKTAPILLGPCQLRSLPTRRRVASNPLAHQFEVYDVPVFASVLKSIALRAFSLQSNAWRSSDSVA